MAWRHPFDGKLSPDGIVGAPFLRRLNAGSLAMAERKFKIGQRVYIHSRSRPPLFAPRGPYKIIDRLPAAERGFEYLIRSEDGLDEHVVREGELGGVT
jgi:hypothetical protein